MLEAAAMNILRWAPAVMLAMYLVGVWDADLLVTAVWGAAKSTEFFKKPMAEAYVAAFSFISWINLFMFADAVPGLMRFRMTKFAYDTKPAHLMVCVGVMIWATFLAIGEPFGRVLPFVMLAVHALVAGFARSWAVLRAHDGMVYYAVRGYFQFMGYLAGVAVLIRCQGGHRPASTGFITFGSLAVEIAVGLIAYDFLFSWLHYAMHKVSWVHSVSEHHQHHEISKFCGRVLAGDTVNHGVIDFTLQVAVNIFVQNMAILGAPKHKLARLLHNVVVTGLLVESHAGYDGFWSSNRLYPGVFAGARRHVEHHAKGKHYYQQFFCYLDDLVFK